MRIDHLLVTAPLQHRVVWAEIDREARKGNRYRQISHRWSSTSIAPAIGSMPAGLQRNRESRRAWESSDKSHEARRWLTVVRQSEPTK
jgi:hypothetical protein